MMKYFEFTVIGMYVVALVSYWLRLAVNVPEQVGRITSLLVRVGVGLQGTMILMRWLNEGVFPVIGYRETLFFLSFAIVAVMVFIETRHELTILGGFVLPLAVLSLIRLPMVATRPSEVPLQLMSRWLPLHVVASFFSYAMFISAFGVGIAYLIQEHQLKARRLGNVLHRLPSLESLDHLGFRLIFWAVPLLASGVVSGMMWTHQVNGTWFRGDPKEWWVIATLGLYAGYLAARRGWGWRGRSAVYFSLIGFGMLLIAFVGVNVVGRHPHY